VIFLGSFFVVKTALAAENQTDDFASAGEPVIAGISTTTSISSFVPLTEVELSEIWATENIENAQPVELDLLVADTGGGRRTNNIRGEMKKKGRSLRANDENRFEHHQDCNYGFTELVPEDEYESQPMEKSGRLFGIRDDGRLDSCGAAVVGEDLILTAAQCVTRPNPSPDGEFINTFRRGWFFCPQYFDSRCPKGIWFGDKGVSFDKYLMEDNLTWDVAIVKVRPFQNASTKVSIITNGFLSVERTTPKASSKSSKSSSRSSTKSSKASKSPKASKASKASKSSKSKSKCKEKVLGLGYPDNIGNNIFMVRSFGTAKYVPVFVNGEEQLVLRYRSDMARGSSGGPILQQCYSSEWTTVGINGFLDTDLPGFLFSPTFGADDEPNVDDLLAEANKLS